MTKVGIIGTGMLGEAVGLHLLNSNHTVTVFNRTKDKTEKLVDAGATLAESPKEVAENSDLVITVVRDADACLLYTSPSPRDRTRSRMPSSA